MLNYGPALLIIFSVVVGILFNRRDVNSLREDVNRLSDRMDKRLALIESDQKQFFTITGKLEGRIEELHRK